MDKFNDDRYPAFHICTLFDGKEIVFQNGAFYIVFAHDLVKRNNSLIKLKNEYENLKRIILKKYY